MHPAETAADLLRDLPRDVIVSCSIIDEEVRNRFVAFF